MKHSKTALLIATVMASNSMAFALDLQDSKTILQNDLHQNAAVLASLLPKTDQDTIQDVKKAYDEVIGLTKSLEAIKNSNGDDFFLKWAKGIQLALLSASSVALNSHAKNSEKSKLALHIAAASALLNTIERHYTSIKRMQPEDIGLILTDFTNDMERANASTPEMKELTNSLRDISTGLLSEKSELNTLVQNLGGGSDIATLALIGLSIAHYFNPKLADEAETVIKSVSKQIATKGAALGKVGKVLLGSGTVSSASDILGMSLGIDSKSSQIIIAKTLNNLNKAANGIKAQIPKN